MKTRLEKYGFKDRQGHSLELCLDYYDIVDALEKAKELIEREDWIYVGDLGQAIAKVFEKEVEDLPLAAHEITLKIDKNKPIPLWYSQAICINCKNLQYRRINEKHKGSPIHEMWCGHYHCEIDGMIETCGHFDQRRDKDNKDENSINYQLEQAGFSKKEQLLILNIIDLVWRNRNEFKE